MNSAAQRPTVIRIRYSALTLTYLKMSVLTRVGLNSDSQRPAVIRIRYSAPTLTYLKMSVLIRVGLNSAAQRPAVERPNLDLSEDVRLDQGWFEL